MPRGHLPPAHLGEIPSKAATPTAAPAPEATGILEMHAQAAAASVTATEPLTTAAAAPETSARAAAPDRKSVV